MLNNMELKDIQEIESKYYMRPILEKINSLLPDNQDAKKEFVKNSFNHIYEYVITSKEDVEAIIQQRKDNGYISDTKQAAKTVVGSIFSNTIVWIFLKNKDVGNIDDNIYITSHKKRVPNNAELFTINVGEETQKPDMDLAVYSLNEDESLKKCMILSLKTSLRERAGQTYKWKLLMEIANSASDIKERYNIEYNPPVNPVVCFATINFYDEINNPQHRGMFKFFDCAFIGKNIETGDFIKPLSYLIDYTREILL